MLLIASSAERAGASSVETLSNRMRGSSLAAAASKAGAMARQGPHQEAQKSTNIGRPLSRMCRRRPCSESASGLPWKRAALHAPQRGPSARRAAGTRLMASQAGQMMFKLPVIALHPQ